MSCVFSSRYNMKADVLTQTSTQTQSGHISRTWSTDRSIDNYSRGILGGGIRVVGSTERFDADYEDIEWVKMRTQDASITKRDRVTNITKSGTQLWTDFNGNPKVFDVFGVTPVIDPFGSPIEYEVLLKAVTND